MVDTLIHLMDADGQMLAFTCCTDAVLREAFAPRGGASS